MKKFITVLVTLFVFQIGFGQSQGTKKLKADHKEQISKLVNSQSKAISDLKADRDSKLAPVNASAAKLTTGYQEDLKNYKKIYGENSADVKKLTAEYKEKMAPLDKQKKQINSAYNANAKAITSKQIGRQNKLINRQSQETSIANKRDAAERQNSQKAKNAMVNISRKADAQNVANKEAKAKLLTKQSKERTALVNKNAQREGAIVRSQQDKLLQKNQDYNKDFARRMNDPNGKAVPVSDLPRTQNGKATDKSFKETSKLIKNNSKTLEKEKKQLAKTQKNERAQLKKEIKKANSSVKKKNSSTIKKAGKNLKDKAKKINEKANKAVKKVRKGRRG